MVCEMGERVCINIRRHVNGDYFACVSVCTSVCGCMGVWVYGCVGVWFVADYFLFIPECIGMTPL
jgi:hypothetical protein